MFSISRKTLFLLAAIAGLAFSIPSIQAQEQAATASSDFKPAVLQEQLKKSQAGCIAATVIIWPLKDNPVTATGVIISEDGLMLTAAHVTSLGNDGGKFRIQLADGKKVQASLLGSDKTGDLSLLKIDHDGTAKFPFVNLAKKSPDLGTFCFVLGHPDKFFEGRPPQLRLGRITSRAMEGNDLVMLITDANIQPGDSGSPLFDLDGNLIGINSSAGNYMNFNRAVPVETYYRDREKFTGGNTWGELKAGPLKLEIDPRIDSSREGITRMAEEFTRRLKAGYEPIVQIVQKNVTPDGKLKVDAQMLVDALGVDALAISRGQNTVLGINDPALANRLPDCDQLKLVRPLPVISGDKILEMSTAIDSRHVITTLSPVEGVADLKCRKGNEVLNAAIAYADKENNIAILDLGETANLVPADFSKISKDAAPGTIVLCPHPAKGYISWGVVSDSARKVEGGGEVGPLLNEKDLISKNRGPYAKVIATDVDIFAAEMGCPAYDLEGNFLGIGLARKSRTLAFILPADIVAELKTKIPADRTSK